METILQVPVFEKNFLGGYSPFIITSLFGEKRSKSYHAGIDIGCPVGTVIDSPLDGLVVHHMGNNLKGYGKYVVLRHHIGYGDYLDIYFAHLSSISNSLELNSEIKKGSYIGLTGNTGHSTGPHLHLEIRHINSPINPIDFLMKSKLIINKTKKVYGNGGVYDDTKDWFVWEVDFQTLSNVVNNTGAVEPLNNATEPDAKTQDLSLKNTIAKERNAAGIWGITKLLIDSSVSSKQVVDSSIASQQGSLLNFFRKVCQSPMVEFFGDTYGDQYYYIVRKPPFDKEGFKNMMELAMLEINSNDLLSTSLDWNNQGIYSWYQYLPKAQLQVGDFNLSALVPAVFFPEYASIWGSKPLCVESNYFTWVSSGKYNNDKKENKANDDNTIAAAFEDLRYIIECNAYAPFCRRGTITIKGDRRFKKGTLVKHTSGEVFHIDEVENSWSITNNSISRTTTLTVSRGLYPEFIEGALVDGSDFRYSYFNIIDFGTSNEKITSDNWRNVMSKWKVNLDVFGYFMSKQQVIRRQMLNR